MKNSSSRSSRDLETLLEAIRSSEVVENRVQLLKELEVLDIRDKATVNSVIKSLTIFWEDFTCLDISQCMLNKTIIQVAAKYLEADISGCIVQFFVLGTKANIWCRKHLKMTLMSTEDSPEEEHSNFFYQLVLDLFSYSAAIYTTLARYPLSTDKDLVASLQNFITEQFAMMKDLVSEIKRMQVLAPELLKAAQVALDAVTRLCKVYCNDVNWDVYNAKADDETTIDCKEAENGNNTIHLTNCIVEKLCEMGTVAATDGGSLVSLLNMSWKGVVSLLQFGKGALATRVNITGVIMNLISLASESLRCAAENWSSSIKEKVSLADAKRTFLPIKFYLINAVRIISQYQTQAFLVYKEIALCVVMILTFRISLSMVEHLKSASEVLVEILEPTSLHLLNSLLNSALVKQENKFQILDWLFNNEINMSPAVDSNNSNNNMLDAFFSVSSCALNREKILTIGRVALFLNLLKCAPDLEDDVRFGIARKLGCLFDLIIDEDIYSSILVLQTPLVHGSSQNHEFSYQPMFSTIIDALKIFFIVVFPTLVWNEVESFLIENLFHPHILCWEIITEIWCFVLRYADPDMVNDFVDKLCALLMLTSRESALFPESALRKTARLICILVTYGPELMVDRVYSSIFNGSRSQCELALLMEGFPLNCLSEDNRSSAKQKIVTQYYEFLECSEDKTPGEIIPGIYGAPVFALCAAMQSLQISISDTEMKTLKFLVAVIHKYRTSSDDAIKDNYRRLLGELLGIISNMKHLYAFDEMEEVMLELQIISRHSVSDSKLFLCKPNLSYFMAGLGHMDLADSEDNAKSVATWELYHMLLKERHWAFVHLAITAFGYFASHTSCNQLWRYVPQDAALSFDLESANESDEERFMSELKAVLEKEMACPTVQVSPDQLSMLVKEGQLLKEIIRSSNNRRDSEATICDMMEIDDEKQPNKKRKFPDGICKGVELLQSGLKVMVDGLFQWQQNQNDSSEVHEMFLAHFSRLEDVIAHLVSLADTS